MKRRIGKQRFIIVFMCIALFSMGCKIDKIVEDSTENINSSDKSETEEMSKESFSEAEINYLVNEAIEICFMFNVEMNYDFDSLIEVDGVQWGKVTESKFGSIKELEDYLSSVFVDNTVYEEYQVDQVFQEFDGELYTSRIGSMGAYVRYTTDSPELIEIRKQEKILVFRKEYMEMGNEVLQFIDIEVVFVENKGFRLNSTINTY